MSWTERLRRLPWLRRFYRLVMAPVSGDSVRALVQRPHVLALLPRQAGRALDAGCGTGLYSYDLAVRAGGRLSAVDYDAGQLILNRRGATVRGLSVGYAAADLTALPFAGGAFDTVLVSEVLEHVPDDRAAAAELARVLAPGGRLVVTVPHPPEPVPSDPAVPGGHVREGYTLESMRRLLQGAGLDVLDHRTCMFRFTRAWLRAYTTWTRRTGWRPPAFCAWPALLDRLLPRAWAGPPYDLVVSARKAGAR